MADSTYNVFVEAYNNFDHRPLKGDSLRKFYIDDFTKDTTESIVTTVEITERFRKILVIGHMGCGKSTILNKVAEELEEQYHVINFSVMDELNIMDIEAIDVLTVIYIQLIDYASSQRVRNLFSPFESFVQNIKENFNISSTEAGIDLLKTFSFKIKVEAESREAIRREFKNRLQILQRNISEGCKTIAEEAVSFKFTASSFENLRDETVPIPDDVLESLRPLENKHYQNRERDKFIEDIKQQIGEEQLKRYRGIFLKHAKIQKDVLIIIDDLDKLKNEFAEKIFFDEARLLTMIDAKIIFTFPLANYYSPLFNQISDKFEDEFIQLIDLYTSNGKYQQESLEMLKKLILKRIDKKYISDDAMKHLIDHSGGLLRDLVKFMQDACKLALLQKVKTIADSTEIPQKVIQDKINEYKAVFDFPEYENDVKEIIQKRTRTGIKSAHLNYLLRYLFVLEYGRRGEESWYDAHPCLKELLS